MKRVVLGKALWLFKRRLLQIGTNVVLEIFSVELDPRISWCSTFYVDDAPTPFPTSISVQTVSCDSTIRKDIIFLLMQLNKHEDGVPHGSSSTSRIEECHQLGRYWPLTTHSPDAHQDQICIIRLRVAGLQIRDHEAHRWNMCLLKSTLQFPGPSSDTYRIKKTADS